MVKSTYFVKKWGKMLHIYDPIFRRNFWYQKVKDKEESKKIFKKLGIDYEFKDNTSGGFAVYEKFGQEICIMWTGGKSNDIVHECTHATRWVMEMAGIEHTKETDEIYAYHTAFLFRAITQLGR